jgi:hypothetical protein
LFAPADVLHHRSCIEKAETPDEFRFLLNQKSE